MMVGALGWTLFGLAETLTSFTFNPVPYSVRVWTKLLGVGLCTYLVVGAAAGALGALVAVLFKRRSPPGKPWTWHFSWTVTILALVAAAWAIKLLCYRTGYYMFLAGAGMTGACGLLVFFYLWKKLATAETFLARRLFAFLAGCITIPVLVFGGAALNETYLSAKPVPTKVLVSLAYLLAAVLAGRLFYALLVASAWVAGRTWSGLRRLPRVAAFSLLLGIVWLATTTVLVAWPRQRVKPLPDGGGVNVVLITLDALRPDHLGCYGYHRQTSPHIDEFARSATRFTEAITQSSYTKGAVTSILSGQYVVQHGMRHHYQVLPRDVELLPQVLRRYGYDTAGFVWSQFLSPAMGYGNRFDSYDAFVPVPFSRFCLVRFQDALGLWPVEQGYPSAARITRRALDWLRNPKQPFFLYLHYKEPHYPYEAPDQYRLWSEPGRTPIDPFILFERLAKDPDYLHTPEFKQEWLDILDAYDACTRYGDEKVGEVFSALQAAGLYDDALIILSADHGEEFLEHAAGMHHYYVYDEVIRVPLLVKLPRGRRETPPVVPAQVSGIDIAPTILEVCGLPDQALPASGTSLLPLMLGETEGGERLSFSESEQGARIAVRSQHFKYIWKADAEDEFYDLQNDPQERENLIGREVPELAHLLSSLQWYQQLSASAPRQRILRVDEEVAEQMRSVGYLSSHPDVKVVPLDPESAREINATGGWPPLKQNRTKKSTRPE